MSEEKETSDAEGETDDDGAETKKGLNPLILGAIALVAAAASGAGAFAFAPGPEKHAEAGDDHGDAGESAHGDGHGKKDSAGKKKKKGHGDEKKHAKKKKKDKKGHGKDKGGDADDGASGGLAGIKVVEVGDHAYVEFPPLVISIRPIGRTRHLKVGIVIETAIDDAEALKYQAYHVNDILNTYLRTVNADRFEDPAAMTALKEQIEHRIRIVAPDVTIHNTLITEFLLS